MTWIKTAISLVAAALIGIAASSAVEAVTLGSTTGPFRDTAALESNWVRGVTTPEQVRSLVGAPNGSGGFVGIVDYRPYEIWFYDDLEALGTTRAGDKTFDIKMRQQFLMVFFRDGRYQGHMWFSNDSAATGWVH
jgi:hypothetical protein